MAKKEHEEVSYDCKTGIKIKGRKTLIMFPPKDGWKEQSLYLVKASFHSNNPISYYYFYTGFVNDGIPSNYNEILLTEDFSNINNLVYLEAVELLHTIGKFYGLTTPDDLQKKNLLNWG